jgi:hypothetical protein
MELGYGIKVEDLNGKTLGTVDHLVRNTWTGEISKFVVRREAPDQDLFLSPEDVSEVTESTAKLKASAEELLQRQSS